MIFSFFFFSFKGNNPYIHTYIMTNQYGADIWCVFFLQSLLVFSLDLFIRIWNQNIDMNKGHCPKSSVHPFSPNARHELLFWKENRFFSFFFVGNTNWKMTLLCKCNDCFYSRGILSSGCCKSKYFPVFSLYNFSSVCSRLLAHDVIIVQLNLQILWISCNGIGRTKSHVDYFRSNILYNIISQTRSVCSIIKNVGLCEFLENLY